MLPITLNRWQRLESLGALLVMVGLSIAGSFLGFVAMQRYDAGPPAYAWQARNQVDAMLSVLNRGRVTEVVTHRRCYGNDRLSPCAEITTSEGLHLQALGPGFRIGVALPAPLADQAAALKREADRVDQDGVADHSVLTMVLGTMGAHLADDPSPGHTPTPVDAPARRPVPLVPGTVTVKGFDAIPTATGQTVLWRLTPVNPNPTPRLLNEEEGLWWFTVPLVLAGPALEALRDHPLPPAQRLTP